MYLKYYNSPSDRYIVFYLTLPKRQPFMIGYCYLGDGEFFAFSISSIYEDTALYYTNYSDPFLTIGKFLVKPSNEYQNIFNGIRIFAS
jgi:hypothetical protein